MKKQLNIRLSDLDMAAIRAAAATHGATASGLVRAIIRDYLAAKHTESQDN